MANTPVYTRGVKYIKVARIDANGKNNTNQLQNLTDIREVFSDILYPIQYDIVGISEYPDYYLYSIIPTDITSSANQEVLNYKTSASSNTLDNGYAGQFINYSINTNTLNYLTASSGFYTLHNTPNVTIQITGSATITYNGYLTDPTVFFLYSNASLSAPIVASASLPPAPGTYTVTLSGSFTPVKNTSFSFGIEPGDYGVISATLQFKVTQSVNPQSSTTDVVVLEPYVDENFDISDCNVLQNNVDINRFDGFFMEMDFTSGSILPQNQSAILNGKAMRAQVQPWNYTYSSQVISRYSGKEQNAIAVNVYTSASQFVTASAYGFSGSWPGDTTSPSLNGGVVLQQLDSCIYETNWAGGGYPENSYGGAFSLGDIMLVGENKDVVQIFKSDSPLYYQILNQNLSFSSSFIQRSYTPNNALSSQLTSLYPGVQLQDAAYWMPYTYNPSVQITASFYPTGSPTYPNTSYLQISTEGSVGNPCTIPAGIRNALGVQQTGSDASMSASLFTISASVALGNPWFVSMYQTLGNIADGTNFYQYGYPFQIYKVIYDSSSTGKPCYLFIKNNPSPFFPVTSVPYNVYKFAHSGSFNYNGLLFTPGYTNQNQLVTYGDTWQNFSLNAGYLTLPYPKDVITQNANYITKQYGNNPNP